MIKVSLPATNGDGFVDLIFAPDGNFPSFHFGTAVNLGNGTFAPTVVTNVFSCGEGTIDAADLDGDGDRDIVLTEEETCPGSDARILFFGMTETRTSSECPISRFRVDCRTVWLWRM